MTQQVDDKGERGKVRENIADQVIRLVMTVPDREFSNLTVAVLASLLGIDRYKLSRQFKRHTNMTLENFLYREKMTRAAFLLKSNQSILVKEVSDRIGFCNPDYFIKRFRAYYGIVPGRYKALKTCLHTPAGNCLMPSSLPKN